MLRHLMFCFDYNFRVLDNRQLPHGEPACWARLPAGALPGGAEGSDSRRGSSQALCKQPGGFNAGSCC